MTHLSPHAYAGRYKTITCKGCSARSSKAIEDLTGSTSVRSITKEIWLNLNYDAGANVIREWIEIGGSRGAMAPDINNPFPPVSLTPWSGHFFAFMIQSGSNYVYRESIYGSQNPLGEYTYSLERTPTTNEWAWKIDDATIYTLVCNQGESVSISNGIEIQDDTMNFGSGTTFRHWLYKDSSTDTWKLIESDVSNDQNGINSMASSFTLVSCDVDNNVIEFTHS